MVSVIATPYHWSIEPICASEASPPTLKLRSLAVLTQNHQGFELIIEVRMAIK